MKESPPKNPHPPARAEHEPLLPYRPAIIGSCGPIHARMAMRVAVVLLACCIGHSVSAEDIVIPGGTAYYGNMFVGTTSTSSITNDAGLTFIASGANVTFNATTQIVLKPNFIAANGSTFTARLVAPALTLSISGPSTVNVSTQTQYSATARDQYGQPLSPQPAFAWSLTGSGTISSTGMFSSSASPGSVSLRVSGTSNGVTLSATQAVSVTLQPPLPRFTFSNVAYPLVYAFDASTSSPSGTGAIASYTWDFGDGTTGSGVTVASHRFPTGGTFQVKLTVADSSGSQASLIQPVSIATSREAYYGNFSTVSGQINYQYGYSPSAYSVPVGLGWISGGGSALSFTPDTGSPSRYIYFNEFTVGAASSYPLSPAYDAVSYAATTLDPNRLGIGQCYMGKGWIAHDSGGQKLIADKSFPSTFIYFKVIQNANTLYNNIRHPPNFVLTWGAIYDFRPFGPPKPGQGGTDVVLSRGWIEGYMSNQQVTPDRSIPSMPCFAGSYKIIDQSSPWIQPFAPAVNYFPSLVVPAKLFSSTGEPSLATHGVMLNGVQWANTKSILNNGANIGMGYLSADGFNITFSP